MSQFKVGDRVRLKRDYSPPAGCEGEGEIVELGRVTTGGEQFVVVQFETRRLDGYFACRFEKVPDYVAASSPNRLNGTITVTDELTPAGLMLLLQEADDELDDLRAAHDHAVYEANMRVLREFLTALAEKRVTAPAMGAEVLVKRLFPEDSK